MRILYHHRTQAEDGQAVHIRALQDAFRQMGHVVNEVGLVAQGGGDAQRGRSRWGWVTKLPPFLVELAEYGYGYSVGRRRILSAAWSFDPDFVYERYAFGNVGGVAAAKRLGVPLVLEVNSPMVYELGRTRGLAFESLARKTETWIFTHADLVCVVTGVLRDMLVEMGVAAERLLVTPNGVELERYRCDDPAAARAAARAALGLPPQGEDPSRGVVLGFVGYYRDWHRLDLAMECLAEEELADARLVLVGAGPAHDALVARAAELGVADRVTFAGRRAHEDVPALLPAFDVALLPAINAYASPLKLHEYMAAGLPTVAPRQENLLEVLAHRENALLFAPGDGEGLAAAVRELCADAELREELGEAARRTIVERDLTWRGNVRRIVAAVEELGR